MSKCPRCGSRVDDGMFAICARCGATPGASSAYGPEVPASQIDDGTRPVIFGDPPGVPAFARNLSRLLLGLVLVGVVAGIGFALFAATVGDDDGTAEPEAAEAAAASEPASVAPETVAASSAAETAAAAADPGTTTAPATSRSEASCTRLWNSAVNEGARDGVAALGARRARVRASDTACVVIAILPEQPPTATRFVAEDRAYAPAGAAARVPEPNARFDANGRLRRQ